VRRKMTNKNTFEIEDKNIISFRVSKIDFMQKPLENFIEIRKIGGEYITLPEKWFERMCDWYYENHKKMTNSKEKARRIEELPEREEWKDIDNGDLYLIKKLNEIIRHLNKEK
jgi:hypothetical protein